MLHTGNIEASHDLREKDFEKLQHDKVNKNIFDLIHTTFSIIHFFKKYHLLHTD
jgi:hypothetical protein